MFDSNPEFFGWKLFQNKIVWALETNFTVKTCREWERERERQNLCTFLSHSLSLPLPIHNPHYLVTHAWQYKNSLYHRESVWWEKTHNFYIKIFISKTERRERKKSRILFPGRIFFKNTKDKRIENKKTKPWESFWGAKKN